MGISVVIPVYNGQQTLARCLDSVLGQTLAPDEVIVVDDGSTDETAAVAARYDGRVRYLYQPNRGVSAARNTGIRAAHGEWIAFQDADDVWLPEKLQRQMALLERNPHLDWVVCRLERKPGGVTIDPAIVERLLAGREYLDDFFTLLPVQAWAFSIVLMVRRSLLGRSGLFRVGQAYGEDLDLYLRIACHAPAIGFVNEPLAVYEIGQSANATARPIRWRTHHLLESYRRYWALARPLASRSRSVRTFIAKWGGILAYQCWREGDYDCLRTIQTRIGFALPWHTRLALFFLACLPPLEGLECDCQIALFGRQRSVCVRRFISYWLHAGDRKSLRPFKP